MSSPTTSSAGQAQKPVLLLFGPQQSNIRPSEVTKLIHTISNTPNLSFLLEIIQGLEDTWTAIVNAYPALKTVPGDKALQHLQLLFNSGSEAADLRQVPASSILLNAITVLLHVVEFCHLATTQVQIDSLPAGVEGGASARVEDVQGFCIGFLSAAAVASAKTREDLERNVGAALRLAISVGALIELNNAITSPGASVSVAWSSEVQHEEFKRILGGIPDGYVSCVTDKSRVTITLHDHDVKDVLQQFSAAGLSSQLIRLRGRFHSEHAHTDGVHALQQLFQQDVRFQLPEAKELVLPLRSNINGDLISNGSLHDEAIRSILQHQCEWYKTVHTAAATSGIEPGSIISVGSEGAVPRSISNRHSSNTNGLTNGATTNGISTHAPNGVNGFDDNPHATTPPIAIIGMACRYPESDSLEEFWELLQAGRSTVQPVPESRFKLSELQRHPKGPFWGNFLDHPDRFDHRFFGISGREAKSMDPQQRLLLEVAYEALESAGYFGLQATATEVPSDVGCYLGIGAVDYGDNIASHDANAFSALGTLRAFISGRVSHYFGWSGPSITLDTACSSGLVALHSAVNALKANECSMALAGGVNVITSPALFQNLGAASFLSPTGASKAFDERADGYCRGEGVGLVVLKPLAQAQADGDSILGIIRGSAVNQGGNCTPITVPVSGSQSALYRKTLSMSGIKPADVTYVEAHGTGTPVGDPIECESIRTVFGSPDRETQLLVGSVKDNVGHTESASGATGLIKAVLMMQKQVIPKQANFTRLSPRIPPLDPDRMGIAQKTQPWVAPRRIALVNNYGAAGSNAAMVIEESKKQSITTGLNDRSYLSASNWPFFVSAKSLESLQEYCTSLASFLPKVQQMHGVSATMDLAYNLSVKQNRGFPFSRTFLASNLDDLATQLKAVGTEPKSKTPPAEEQKLPVVLCIGGQNGTTVHLDPSLYRNSFLLQTHLDSCDRACTKLNLPSLFPSILSAELVEDLVKLHCMLFSLQYACAKTWIDSGLKVDTIIGHSFGQLTALVVAGSLSLVDGLRLVSERARLIRDAWGDDTGAMLSVQASPQTVSRMLEDSRKEFASLAVDIACINGPESVVLAGDKYSIANTEARCRQEGLKTVRLSNTHAFHSRLVDPIIPCLREVVGSCTFHRPSIRIEACGDNQDWSEFITTEDVIQQTRMPVLFHEAVARISARLGDCVWVEAGSASPIIPMVRRCLSTGSRNVFQPVDIRAPDALSNISRAIGNLWTNGKSVQHWSFHRAQGNEYNWINLPPYSFNKTSSWLDYVPPAALVPIKAQDPVPQIERPKELIELVEKGDQGATFSISSSHPMFTYCTKGHAVLGQALCPASLYVELATQAAKSLKALKSPTSGLSVRDLKISAPLSISSNRHVLLRLLPIVQEQNTWQFTVLSQAGQERAGPSTTHATGVISIDAGNSLFPAGKMQSLRRLVGQVRAEQLSGAPESNVLQGKNIYRIFGQVVDYSPYYRGVQQIVSKANESVGLVRLPASQTPGLADTGIDPVLLDNFLQVAGIHVNCLSDRAEEEVFICTELGHLVLSESFASKWRQVPAWNVYSTFESPTEKNLSNDILIYDAESGDLQVMFIGATFHSIPMKSLARSLMKLNAAPGASQAVPNGGVNGYAKKDLVVSPQVPAAPVAQTINAPQGSSSTSLADTVELVRELLSSVIEIPLDEIQPDAALVDIGIDSLLSTEVLNEITKRFDITIPASDFLEIDTVTSLARYLNPSVTAPATNGHTPNGQTAEVPVVNGTGKPAGVLPQVQDMLCEILGMPISDLPAEASLNDIGVDSLLATEVLEEVRKRFGVTITADAFQNLETLADLANHIQPTSTYDSAPQISVQKPNGILSPKQAYQPTLQEAQSTRSLVSIAQETFANLRERVDDIFPQTQFGDFCTSVLPLQKELVVAYIVEAFQTLGCSLAELSTGERIPDLTMLPRHRKVKNQIYYILEDAGLVLRDSSGHYSRTATAVPQSSSKVLHEAILTQFPQHVYEHKLLASTGSKLAGCLIGDIDPIGILFGNADARTLMTNVYTHAPMFKTGTIQLARYLGDLFNRFEDSRPIRILELGAGTGGTTKYLVEHLVGTGQEFQYTFTDISSSLVAAAKRNFSKYNFMKYAIVNIEEEPPAELLGQYDIILSTNCIHATKDLVTSCTHIRKLLRPDGILCLVELTRNLFWFDLVFGLLDGWWRFEDGRQHALANENLWRKYLSRAGFRWIDWTDGASDESDILRVITASSSAEPTSMETVEFKKVDGLSLEADIYYPNGISTSGKALPVALMIHGGGHIMLSRKDIRPAQVQMLLQRGFIPISVDFRLCPETTLQDGPMRDVCDALSWIQTGLPNLKLQRPDIRIDSSRVVAVGWSTGGHLALTLGFTSLQRGIRPPDAILAFYCPLDYEDPCWGQPNFPFGQQVDADEVLGKYDLREGLYDRPVLAYNPPPSKRALAGWMAPSDARSQLALLMNWKGRSLRLLLNGLSRSAQSASQDPTDELPDPTLEQIQSVSPYAQIRSGVYRTPTFIIHGTKDDLIPWEQAARTHDALRAHGVKAEVRILDGVVHLFDLFRSYEKDSKCVQAVMDAYDFLQNQVHA